MDYGIASMSRTGSRFAVVNQAAQKAIAIMGSEDEAELIFTAASPSASAPAGSRRDTKSPHPSIPRGTSDPPMGGNQVLSPVSRLTPCRTFIELPAGRRWIDAMRRSVRSNLRICACIRRRIGVPESRYDRLLQSRAIAWRSSISHGLEPAASTRVASDRGRRSSSMPHR